MKDSLFWRLAVAGLIATGMYIGHGLHSSSELTLPDPFLATPVYAGGVSAMTEDTEYFITASQEGRTVFVWEFDEARPPRFHAQATAKQ